MSMLMAAGLVFGLSYCAADSAGGTAVPAGGSSGDSSSSSSSSSSSAAAATAGQVIISEVMAKDSGTPGGDWVELYNTTTSTLSVGGYVVADTNPIESKYFTIDAGVTIPEHGYIVVCLDSTKTYTGVTCADGADTGHAGIKDDGSENPALYTDSTGVTAIDVTDLPANAQAGYSMEVKAASLNETGNDGEDNWAKNASTTAYGDSNYGTPGAANSN